MRKQHNQDPQFQGGKGSEMWLASVGLSLSSGWTEGRKVRALRGAGQWWASLRKSRPRGFHLSARLPIPGS